MHGKGTLKINRLSLEYTGSFQNNRIKGKGEMKSTKTGNVLIGIFEDLTLIKGNGKIYLNVF